MKTINLFLISIVFLSCAKDKNTEIKNQSKVSDSIKIIENPQKISDYVYNLEDPDDEKIHLQLLELGETAKELFKDNSYCKLIIDEAKNHDNKCIDLKKFIVEAKNSNNYKNKSTNSGDEKVLNKLELLISKADFKHKSTNPNSTIEVENYIPTFYVANLEKANPNEQPLISPGIVVNSDLPGLEKYYDYIVAWYYDESGNFKEILLNEEMAKNTTHPLIIVDNADEVVYKRNKTDFKVVEQSFTNKNLEAATYWTNEFQINHRYDNLSRSEFFIVGYLVRPNGSVEKMFRDDGNNRYVHEKLIKEVRSSEVGKPNGKWQSFCVNSLFPDFNDTYAYFNTFERDWWKSEKPLGEFFHGGVRGYLYGNMGNYGDWYAFSPDAVRSNNVNFSTIYKNWAQIIRNDKGFVQIWRVQP